MYLKEIGKVPLLQGDEEIELAKRMEQETRRRKTPGGSKSEAGGQHCQALCGKRNAVPRFDSGRQSGLDKGC